MTVKCIACTRSTRPAKPDRGEVELLRSGFRLCSFKREPYRWLSTIYPRECPDFVQADSAVEKSRIDWLSKALW